MFSSNDANDFDNLIEVERIDIVYVCKNGHKTDVTFPLTDKTEIPNEWDCKFCSETGVKEGSEIAAKEKKSRKKYAGDTNRAYTMLRERRKDEKELKEDLEEQLKLLRSGKLNKASVMV